MKKLYMKTTGDKLDLPVAVADSPGELARILGTKKSVVLSSISHTIRGWHRIEIEEEEEMERGGMAKEEVEQAAGWEKVRHNAAGLIRLAIGSRLEEGSVILTKEELYTVLLAPSRIDNKIRHIDIKIQELEFMLYPSGIRYDKNNVQASPSDKMGDVMAEIGDLMTLRDNLGAQMPKAMLEVEAVLSDLPRDEYNVMYFKYIGCIPTWEEVARKVNFTERHVFRIKKRAITHLCDKMS